MTVSRFFLKCRLESHKLVWKASMSKPKMRARLAALSFSEKVKILEKLRDRSLAIAASGLRSRTARDGGDRAAIGRPNVLRQR